MIRDSVDMVRAGQYALTMDQTLTQTHDEAHGPEAAASSQKKARWGLGHTIGLVVLVAVGGGVFWHKVLEDYVVPKRFGTVEPGAIYRSGKISGPLIYSVLKDNHIKVVIDLRSSMPGEQTGDAEAIACKKLGIERRHYPLRGDGTGDVNQYIAAVTRLAEAVKAKEPALVHCSAGTQRTGGTIGFYKLLVERKPLDEVYADLRQYDWLDKDTALINYMNEHMSEVAAGLVKAGVIEKAPDPLPVLHP